MSGYASYEDALDPKYGDPYSVPIVMATDESLKGYGTVVTNFEETEVEITPWPVKGWRPLCPDTGTLGVSPDNRTHVLVREANYHPDGGQIFFPQNGDAFVALLALPGDDIQLKDFQAFYFEGSFGVQIHADIWHQPVYPIGNEAVFLGKQGAVYACVAVDTVEEFGKYLSVPLTKPQ